jgi:hypothetical protein
VREFHLGDILSVTGEKLVSPKGIGGVYEILNYMTGDNLFTHQLIRAREVARPEILKQHPQLAAVDESGCNSDNYRDWLAEQVKQFGETLSVEPLSTWKVVDPITELASMAPGKPILVVQVAEGDDNQ